MNKTTKTWWKECLENKEKLEHWLVGVYNNEKDAEERFIKFSKVKDCHDKGLEELGLKIKHCKK
jgi:hypothetical protein